MSPAEKLLHEMAAELTEVVVASYYPAVAEIDRKTCNRLLKKYHRLQSKRATKRQ
ncbi:MAG: hypothetical protein P4L99_21710 [Chthoniobacter sp.]|nr:hypothetical protein [Chthoniobacter sp.]